MVGAGGRLTPPQICSREKPIGVTWREPTRARTSRSGSCPQKRREGSASRPTRAIVERVQAVAVGSAVESEKLTSERRWPLEADVLDRDQLHLSIGLRLIHDCLRPLYVGDLILEIGAAPPSTPLVQGIGA
jgi:hypothetical protein